MKHRVTLIPGDGIGPEVTQPTLQIIKAAGVKIDWDSHLAGAEALKKHGTTIPRALMDSFEKNRVALKGPVTTPVGEGFSSVNVALRQSFNLYANLRPIKNLPGVKARYQGIDLIVVRENTEGLYSGIEHEVVPGVVESLKIMTEKACMKIAKFAFDYARRNGRKKVAAVHKANIMKLSDGLFLDCARKVSTGYKNIGFSDVIVDNACLQLVIDPWNELDHSQPGLMREDQYISAAITKIRQFARSHAVHVWIIAHPTKMQKLEGRYEVPRPYDVSGAAHWANKADMALSIYRDLQREDGPTEVHIQKVRNRECGRIGMVEVWYDKYTGRYSETGPDTAAHTAWGQRTGDEMDF